MTNAMPMLINSFVPFLTNSNSHNEVKFLIETAREEFIAAEAETGHGDAAMAMIDGQERDRAKSHLCEIASWHYERSVIQFQQALEKFDQAGSYYLPTKYVKYVESKKPECVRRAAAAVAKICTVVTTVH